MAQTFDDWYDAEGFDIWDREFYECLKDAWNAGYDAGKGEERNLVTKLERSAYFIPVDSAGNRGPCEQ